MVAILAEERVAGALTKLTSIIRIDLTA
jgi:hypothetical protein